MISVKKILLVVFLLLVVVIAFVFSSASKLGPVRNSAPSKLTAQSLKDFCKEESACFSTQLGLYMEKNGVKPTLILLNKTSKITNGLNNDCHNISHKLGGLAFKLIGAEATKLHENSCQWGFGHGVMVAASSKLPIEEFSPTFKEFCMEDPEPVGCVHGIGHSLRTRGATPEQTQEICREVSLKYDAPREENYDPASKTASGTCVEGFVMQALGDYAWNDLPDGKSAVGFCEGFTGLALSVCNGMAIRNYVDIVSQDEVRLERTMQFKKYCDTVKESQGYECGRYLGEAADDATIPGSSFEPSYVASKMNLFCSGRWVDACTTSFTNYQVNRNDGNYKYMLATCKLLDIKLKNYCLTSISNRAQVSVEDLLKEKA
jgi:hypothetical protein